MQKQLLLFFFGGGGVGGGLFLPALSDVNQLCDDDFCSGVRCFRCEGKMKKKGRGRVPYALH